MKFRLIAALLFLHLIPFAATAAEPEIVLEAPKISLMQRAKNMFFFSRKGYLDLEDNQQQSVFNLPGRDWKTCEMDKNCKAIGWPDRDSEIEVLSYPTKVRTYDYKTNEYVEQEYVKVRFKYERETALDSTEKGAVKLQQGEGWIDAAYITDKKRNSFFSENPVAENLPVCTTNTVDKNLRDIGAIAKANTDLNKIAAAVQKVTGQCVVNPQEPRRFEAGNIYDNYVMDTVLKQKVPAFQKEDGTALTSQDLVDIDSLARSMYGEMAGCFKHGLQYPMAVAKIVQNRAGTTERAREFIKGPHAAGKSPLSKVVTSASQFNVWMAKHGDKMNPSLKMALCPPSNKDKKYHLGRTPPTAELQIWENAIKIATQAVVQPEAFKKRTKQISGFFYTSGMGQFYKMRQVFPTIEDRKIEKNACLEVWMEKPAANSSTARAPAKSSESAKKTAVKEAVSRVTAPKELPLRTNAAKEASAKATAAKVAAASKSAPKPAAAKSEKDSKAKKKP